MELAPALAESLNAPFAPDVTSLEYEGGSLKGSRMVFSGKLESKWQCKKAPTCVATVRPGAFDLPLPGDEAKIRKQTPDLADDLAVKFLGYLKQAAGDVDITAAKILVSVGRGIGGADNIALAQDLADALGGVVSCSRPVADKKWLDKSRQVGTSGQTVKPDIYLALGISGAFQHLAGMQGAKTIIAVNKDSKAPIFGVAHYGIVGDALELLPLITDKLKALCTA
jgi:electron transfer flavoprotein alpha subunit